MFDFTVLRAQSSWNLDAKSKMFILSKQFQVTSITNDQVDQGGKSYNIFILHDIQNGYNVIVSKLQTKLITLYTWNLDTLIAFHKLSSALELFLTFMSSCQRFLACNKWKTTDIYLIPS